MSRGRAVEAFAVQPLKPGYLRETIAFARPRDMVSAYALWGGMPRYWELAEPFGADLDTAVDALVLDQQSRELADQLRALQQQAYEQAGSAFNLGSPKQLGDVLFNRLGLDPVRRTSTGQPSTSESVLQELSAEHPLPATVLQYRNLAKLKTGYTDALPACIDPRTGRVHTSYQQAVAATGRLSSIHPNLQNIPARTPEGRRIRQAFVAPEGQVLLSADYSQIELRIMAQLSGDEGLLKAFSEDMDVHKATAAEVFATPVEAVSADQRRAAKAINFGVIYGISGFGLARNLRIQRTEAQGFIDRYFERFPGIRKDMDDTVRFARDNGYVRTLFGRKIHTPEINAKGPHAGFARRAAINAPIQGTAADIIRRAMIRMDAAIEGLSAKMLLQVHDELVFEVGDVAVEETVSLVCDVMRDAAGPAVHLDVPLTVDFGTGPNWSEAH